MKLSENTSFILLSFFERSFIAYEIKTNVSEQWWVALARYITENAAHPGHSMSLQLIIEISMNDPTILKFSFPCVEAPLLMHCVMILECLLQQNQMFLLHEDLEVSASNYSPQEMMFASSNHKSPSPIWTLSSHVWLLHRRSGTFENSRLLYASLMTYPTLSAQRKCALHQRTGLQSQAHQLIATGKAEAWSSLTLPSRWLSAGSLCPQAWLQSIGTLG